jgi:sporulation protein YqfC
MKKVMDSLSDLLELPKEVMLNIPKITMVGNIQLYIENHRGIIEYSPDRIRINSTVGVLRVKGKAMKIREIKVEELLITGNIESMDITSA